jgi:hypothetical protein
VARGGVRLGLGLLRVCGATRLTAKSASAPAVRTWLDPDKGGGVAVQGLQVGLRQQAGVCVAGAAA